MKRATNIVESVLRMSLVNPAVSVQPTTIYSGTAATLNVTLNNQTGANITVPAGSTLTVYMPAYFSGAEIGAMNITSISVTEWIFSYNAGDGSLLLTYSGASGTWANNSALTFSIENVKTSVASGNDSVQINVNGLQGSNIPAQVSATLLSSAAPVPAHVNLTDVLLVNTEYGGQIYVSTAIDPLTNSLYLDLKNIGAHPLYNSTVPRAGTPTVTVSFVYGSTSGALAPADKSGASQKGSAWSISGAVYVDQTGGWKVDNPVVTGSANSPSWILKPTAVNKEIIGIGENANVSFVFSNIFSFTPTGPTQMYVQFHGFTRDENNIYNDHTFVVPILKSNPPPIRGIINFFGPPLLYIKQQQDVPLDLEWTGYQIASISMVCTAAPSPVPSPYVAAYPNPTPLIYDGTTVTLPAVEPDTQVVFTLSAFDGGGVQLNAPQFLVSIEQKPGIYSFAGPDGNVSFTMNQPSSIQLNWKVYRAASIVIRQGPTEVFRKNYPPSPLWNTDSTSVSVTIPGYSGTQEFTLDAYDAKGNLLETMPWTVTFMANAWCDPKDNKVYPLVRINNQVWFGSNYDYNDPQGGSYFYNNDPTFENPFGRLYLFESALRVVPAGWRLPNKDDWKALVDAVGADPFTQLLPGGSSGLNMQLGGGHYTDGASNFMHTTGLYYGMPKVYPGYVNLFEMEGYFRRLYYLDIPFPLPILSLNGCSLRFILIDTNEKMPAAQEAEPMSMADRACVMRVLFPEQE